MSNQYAQSYGGGSAIATPPPPPPIPNSANTTTQKRIPDKELDDKKRQLFTAGFNLFDKDNNGYLNKQELQQVCLQTGIPLSMVDEILSGLDQDGDDHLDLEEFLGLMTRLQDKEVNKADLHPYPLHTRVQAYWPGTRTWYKGRVELVNSDRSVNVLFDDGDKRPRVPLAEVRPIDAVPHPVGSRVQAYWPATKSFYPGRVAFVHPDGAVNVDFDDGDKRANIPIHELRNINDTVTTTTSNSQSQQARVQAAAQQARTQAVAQQGRSQALSSLIQPVTHRYHGQMTSERGALWKFPSLELTVTCANGTGRGTMRDSGGKHYNLKQVEIRNGAVVSFVIPWSDGDYIQYIDNWASHFVSGHWKCCSAHRDNPGTRGTFKFWGNSSSSSSQSGCCIVM